MHLVSAEPARIRWQGIPMHALYHTAQNPGPLFGGLDLGWRDGCSGMNRQKHLGPFRKIARRLRHKNAVFENSPYVGPVFDVIFQHVDHPPATPAAYHAGAFVEWAVEHLIQPVNLYTAYPSVTAKQIKALAAAAGLTRAGELNPFLVILPTKSRIAFFETQLLLRARGHGITTDLDTVGTPHFAQFVPLEDNQIGFFTVYDGDFDKYIADFTKNIGQVFDLLFKFTKGAPPSPCRKHLQEFIDFAAGANRAPIGFYSAYPGLSVQDVHTLIADGKTQAASGR